MATRPQPRRRAAAPPGDGGPSPARDRILYLLKTRGPLAASTLAAHLDVSAVAVRQHLAALVEDGLVVAGQPAPGGSGRPARTWTLTMAAMGRFPDTHSDLTVEILRAARAAFGDEGLERLVAERGRQQRAAYLARMQDPLPATGSTAAGTPDKGPGSGAVAPAGRDAPHPAATGDAPAVEGRLERLASLRREEGYMAEWTRAAEGKWLFCENHCPICAAATACQGFCRDELALFREVLGPGVKVERTDHIVAGARRCAYRVEATRGASSTQEDLP